jgi:hypothetical protein
MNYKNYNCCNWWFIVSKRDLPLVGQTVFVYQLSWLRQFDGALWSPGVLGLHLLGQKGIKSLHTNLGIIPLTEGDHFTV